MHRCSGCRGDLAAAVAASVAAVGAGSACVGDMDGACAVGSRERLGGPVGACMGSHKEGMDTAVVVGHSETWLGSGLH